jgi:undecaprenyl-phosphate 4-deoxy-4-formamido-L-arabinose transferase
MKISVVIPVYGGEFTLGDLFARIEQYFAGSGGDYEVVLVYDCGKDNSWKVIQELKQKNPERIKAIRLSRNFGQHNAIICGFKHAEGDYIITMDEDNQQNPDEMGKLIEKITSDNLDVVYGVSNNVAHSTFRTITSNVLKRMLRWGIPDLYPNYSPYRIIRKEIAKECTRLENSYTFLDGYLSWITRSMGEVEVSHSSRTNGKSSYTIGKLVEHSINIFVTFSNLPIRLLSYLSGIVFVTTLIYTIYIIYRVAVYNDVAPGFPTLISFVGFGVSFILLGIGILGEYVHRINLKTTKRPSFLESEIL